MVTMHNRQRLLSADLERECLRDEAERYRAQRRRECPQPAEACTELGADTGDDLAAGEGLVWGVLAGLLLWAAVALIGLAVWF